MKFLDHCRPCFKRCAATGSSKALLTKVVPLHDTVVGRRVDGTLAHSSLPQVDDFERIRCCHEAIGAGVEVKRRRRI
jgi:hypothetical protein